jgi:anaerobic ribonucleoside-triphosphate reductase activating protein
VDGRFLESEKNSLLQFRGSSNQRVIDVPKSVEAGSPVIWAKLHDQERFIPELYGKDRDEEQKA